MTDTTVTRGPSWGDTAIGIGVIVLGLISFWQTSLVPESLYAVVGPRAFGWITATLLTIMGGLLVVSGLRGGWSHEVEEYGPVDWQGGGWLALGLLINLLTIDRLGFIIASTLMFICTARSFGSQKIIRDALMGFCLALFAYVGFDRVLGYKIGSGLIERLI
jgi:putative tricarboxylic transport membrane protein